MHCCFEVVVSETVCTFWGKGELGGVQGEKKKLKQLTPNFMGIVTFRLCLSQTSGRQELHQVFVNSLHNTVIHVIQTRQKTDLLVLGFEFNICSPLKRAHLCYFYSLCNLSQYIINIIASKKQMYNNSANPF